MPEVQFESLNKGLVTKVAPTGLTINQATVAQNVRFPYVGAVIRRPGYGRLLEHRFNGACCLLFQYMCNCDSSRVLLAGYDSVWDTEAAP